MDLDENMNVVDNLTLNIAAPDTETGAVLECSLYSFARNTLVDVIDRTLTEENVNEDLLIESLTIDMVEVDGENALQQLVEKLPALLKAQLSKATFKIKSKPTMTMLSETFRRFLPMDKTFNIEKEFDNYIEEWYQQNSGTKFDALKVSEYIIRIMMGRYPNLDSRQIAYIVYQKIKQMESAARKDSKKTDTLNDVSDSGIVLLAPYIPTLFNRLGFVENNAFKSVELRLKALAILHFAVFGDYKVPQIHSLMMNIFCGYERNFVPQIMPSLTDDEKSMVNGLLDAVVKNWGAVGSTSADGLRSGFLIRKGTLNDEDACLKLKVSQNAYDMLLDKLPWGYSMVKLPWMKSRIDVEWR